MSKQPLGAIYGRYQCINKLVGVVPGSGWDQDHYYDNWHYTLARCRREYPLCETTGAAMSCAGIDKRVHFSFPHACEACASHILCHK